MTSYRIEYRSLGNGMTGVVMVGFCRKHVVRHMVFGAYADRKTLIDVIAEIVIEMAAKGIDIED